jgi:hypothetical protein
MDSITQEQTTRLYVPRKERGRGLIQAEGACIAETIKLVEYVESKDDPLTQIVMAHQKG